MIKQVSRVSPVRFGITSAACVALVWMLTLLVGFIIGMMYTDRSTATPGIFGETIALAIISTIIYAIFAFIFGVACAFIYNFVVVWIGGIKPR